MSTISSHANKPSNSSNSSSKVKFRYSKHIYKQLNKFLKKDAMCWNEMCKSEMWCVKLNIQCLISPTHNKQTHFQPNFQKRHG